MKENTRKKRRSNKDLLTENLLTEKILGEKKLKEYIYSLDNYPAKLISALIYLTAFKVSQVLNLKVKDIIIKENKYLIIKNGKNLARIYWANEQKLYSLIINSLKAKSPEDYIVNFRSRSNAFRLIKKEFSKIGIEFPEFLRVLRRIHIKKEYEHREIDII